MRKTGGINSAMDDIVAHGKLLESAGFQTLAYQDFQEEYINLLQIAPTLDDAALERQFNDPIVSNSIVVYLRFLASAYLKANAILYEPFIMDMGVDLWQFCQSQVEAMDRFEFF
jgi:ubiquitin thioesterase protein OTUB1